MTIDYKKLLHLTYEIEGLLMVQMDRPERHSAELDALIAEKITRLNSLVSDMGPTPSPAEDDNDRIAESVLDEETDDADVPSETLSTQTPEPVLYDDIQLAPVPATVVEEKPEPTDESVVTETVDEKIARDKAKDIFKAFTLNDKFRFRRELFRNSQAEFEETLEVISAMSSMDEAKEYFYEDLCWDPSNEDVKDFMDILEKHF